MYTINGNILAHYGIKGMRWGVTRSPEQLGHRPGEYRESIISRQKKQSPKWVKTEYRNTNPGRRKPMDFKEVSKKARSLRRSIEEGRNKKVMDKVEKRVKTSTLGRIVGSAALIAGGVFIGKALSKKTISNQKVMIKDLQDIIKADKMSYDKLYRAYYGFKG